MSTFPNIKLYGGMAGGGGRMSNNSGLKCKLLFSYLCLSVSLFNSPLPTFPYFSNPTPNPWQPISYFVSLSSTFFKEGWRLGCDKLEDWQKLWKYTDEPLFQEKIEMNHFACIGPWGTAVVSAHRVLKNCLFVCYSFAGLRHKTIGFQLSISRTQLLYWESSQLGHWMWNPNPLLIPPKQRLMTSCLVVCVLGVVYGNCVSQSFTHTLEGVFSHSFNVYKSLG